MKKVFALRRGERMRHIPVLQDSVVEFLATPDAVYIDGTVGDGGHAEMLLRGSRGDPKLLGIDMDPEAIQRTEKRLSPFKNRIRLVHDTFAHLTAITEHEGWTNPTGILFDLGMSTYHLEAERGFSFHSTGPLDMRFDTSGTILLPNPEHQALQKIAKKIPSYRAQDLIDLLPERDLADILYTYGGERYARRIARIIVSKRVREPVRTAEDLARQVVFALPPRARHGRIHAATRTFQAMRIAVNREMETLHRGIDGALHVLAPGGRLAIISFHEGEDRIVKHRFREAARTDMFTVLTKRPITASEEEQSTNPWSRSAKLRVIERTYISHT